MALAIIEDPDEDEDLERAATSSMPKIPPALPALGSPEDLRVLAARDDTSIAWKDFFRELADYYDTRR